MADAIPVSTPHLPHPDPAAFSFVDPGPLADRELQLVTPHPIWIDDVLAACSHPLTQSDDPEHARTTRQQLQDWLAVTPDGHEPPNAGGRVPSYHFWIRLSPHLSPIVPMAGSIGLRIGYTPDIERYFGHIGYHVFPPARGHRYAARSCRLLFPLARHHALRPLWLTTDPDNIPSRQTCELLGAVLVEVIDIPPDHLLYQRGQRRKCRYRIDI